MTTEPKEVKVMASEGCHYYTKTGEPFHEILKKDGTGYRKTTVADAKKLGLYASVTTILGILDKPGLNRWREMNVAQAVLTSPKLEGEDLDTYVDRILNVEKVQDEQAEKARNLGTDIHAAIEQHLRDECFDTSLQSYVTPALMAIFAIGKPLITEKVVIGEGYAGKLDCAMDAADGNIWILDFKTCSKIPKKPYTEHALQLGAYAGAFGNTGDKRIRTANLYINTTNPGEVRLFEHDDWHADFEAFKHVLAIWRYKNGM